MSPGEWRKQLRKLTKDMGWAIEIRRNGHLKLTKPGHGPVFCSQSASDRRAIHRVRTDLRRAENAVSHRMAN